MHRFFVCLLALGLSLGLAGLALGQGFEMSLAGCPEGTLREAPGSTVSRDLTVVMTPTGLTAEDKGAQGWSLSLATDGCTSP